MDAAIRWSSQNTPDRQRLLILNLQEHTLKLLEAGAKEGSKLDFTTISAKSKLPNIRALDWSPADEELVAIGLPSGEAALLRLDDNSNDLLSFTVKHQRLCNAVALSTKNVLAAGLDKVRNDFCLNIWDVNQRLGSWTKEKSGWTSARSQLEPLRKLATSESITSIKFFSDQPDIVAAGVKGQFVRTYDLRESHGNPVLQFATRCVHNLAIDPLNENYLASASNRGEPVVCVWDRRASGRSAAAAQSPGGVSNAYQAGAVLELRDCLGPTTASSNPSIWSVRFSRFEKGALGILGSNGRLKVYETTKDRAEHPREGHGDVQLLRTTRCRDVQYACDDPYYSHDIDKRVITFDFMKFDYQILGYRAHGDLEAFDLQFTPPVFALSTRGELAVAGRRTVGVVLPSESDELGLATAQHATEGAVNGALEVPQLPQSLHSRDLASSENELLSVKKLSTDASTVVPQSTLTKVRDLLGLTTVERRLAQAGYLFDCKRNASFLSRFPDQIDVWSWIEGAEEAAKDNGMVHERLDFSYLGVQAIWKPDLDQDFRSRTADNGRSPTEDEFITAAAAINRRQSRSTYAGIATKFPDQRQLSILICGWAVSSAELDADLGRLKQQGCRTEAAALAMLHGQSKKSVEQLFGGTDADRTVAMALAGYHGFAGLSKDGNEEAWIELCNEIAKNAEDRWTRAILALVSTGSWAAVVAEQALPLRYRLGAALKYLPDRQLTEFLDEVTHDCVGRGDITGIYLTGITDRAMDLLEAYIVKTCDIQTPVLVMSYACPRYIDGMRFDRWREEYLLRLHSYRLHMEVAQYRTQHTKKSRDRMGTLLLKPGPRQISVRCNYCDHSLAPDDVDGETITSISSAAATAGESFSSGVHVGNPLRGPGSSQGVSCPKCDRRLPRCSVCLMWLGVPDPRHQKRGSVGTLSGSGRLDESEDAMSRFLMFCNLCHHGSHAGHARSWFAKHTMCPVPECTCLCFAQEPCG